MPVLSYLNDIVITHDADTIRLMASLYALTVNNINGRLEGNPPAFVPHNPTIDEQNRFVVSYLHAYTFLVPLLNG